jgi:hypothetical protein
MYNLMVFVKSSYGYDNNRPITRSFVYKIGFTVNNVRNHYLRLFAILNR